MTAARQRRTNELEIDDIGVEVLEVTDEYMARLDTLATNLSQVVGRRDAAHVLAEYVAYAREVQQKISHSTPVGLAEWLHVARDGR